MTVAGNEVVLDRPYAGPATEIFAGLNFCTSCRRRLAEMADIDIVIMTDSVKPNRKKADLAQLVQANGGKLYQKPDAAPDTLCIGDKSKCSTLEMGNDTHRTVGTVPVASLIKRGEVDITRSSWILDCIQQTASDGGRPRMLLPLEPRHMFFTKEDSKDMIDENVDEYGDSFARDISIDELRSIFDEMPKLEHSFDVHEFRDQLEEHDHGLGEVPGWMFEGTLIYADFTGKDEANGDMPPESGHGQGNTAQFRMRQACNTARFAGASITEDFEDTNITHILVNDDRTRAKVLRTAIST